MEGRAWEAVPEPGGGGAETHGLAQQHEDDREAQCRECDTWVHTQDESPGRSGEWYMLHLDLHHLIIKNFTPHNIIACL